MALFQHVSNRLFTKSSYVTIIDMLIIHFGTIYNSYVETKVPEVTIGVKLANLPFTPPKLLKLDHLQPSMNQMTHTMSYIIVTQEQKNFYY